MKIFTDFYYVFFIYTEIKQIIHLILEIINKAYSFSFIPLELSQERDQSISRNEFLDPSLFILPFKMFLLDLLLAIKLLSQVNIAASLFARIAEEIYQKI